MVSEMNVRIFTALALLLMPSTQFAADPDSRLFEMRTYYAAPDKLDALNARFRDHTTELFAKHGMTNIGYWMPVDNPERQLIYILAYPNREAREASWKAFMADPDWKKAAQESETAGKLVTKVVQTFLNATDFSPQVQPSKTEAGRLFELRTYMASPGNLGALHARFRDHTLALFQKHGMTSLAYFQPAAGQPGAEATLIYLLAHANVDAAKASWKAFRADPTWIAAKTESETRAGGSLTAPDGVKSVMLQPTDYSPTR